MKKVVLNILIVVFALLVIGSVFAFINGSLEMYPTEEQIEKSRIAAAAFGIITLSVEVFLIRLRVKK